MTTYWADARVAPGRRRAATSASTIADGRFTVGRRPVPSRGDDAPPARRRPARLRQRPLARVPPGAARPHARRRRHVLDLARADVRPRRPPRPRLATSRSRAPPTPRWRSPASRRSGSSTTCTTRPGGARYDDPNAMAEALRRPRATPAPAHPARHLLPHRRASTTPTRGRRSCASATATPTRGPPASPRSAPDGTSRSAPRSTPSAPCRSTHLPTVVAARRPAGRCTSTCPSSRAENEAGAGALRRDPDRACWPTPAPSARRRPRSTRRT